MLLFSNHLSIIMLKLLKLQHGWDALILTRWNSWMKFIQFISQPSNHQLSNRHFGQLVSFPSTLLLLFPSLGEAVPLITYSPAEDPAPSSSGIPLNIPSLPV